MVRSIDVQTGQETTRDYTAEELEATQAMAQAAAMSQTDIDPVTKLRQFLAANPDVAAIL